MSENSAIEWCDHTFNPWMGCTKVGPGCDHCYAETMMDTRYGKVQWGVGNPRVRTSAANWRKPLQWNAQADYFQAEHGRRQRVFCASLADVFDNGIDPQWRTDLWTLIASTPKLDWLLLTKRIGNVESMLPTAPAHYRPWNEKWPWPSVWIGATIVNQEEADRDIPKLLALPARVRFLSCEPMLGPISLGRWLWTCCGNIQAGSEADGMPGGACCNQPERLDDLDWVIVGGESGPGARPMHPDWARNLRDQCAAAGVPFLFKQHGEWAPGEALDHVDAELRERSIRIDGTEPSLDFDYFGPGKDRLVYRAGKKASGRLLDGVQHDGFPT